MTFEEGYNLLAAWASRAGLTAAQVRQIAWMQMAKRLKDTSITDVLWERIKARCCDVLEDAENASVLQQFRTALQDTVNVIKDNYPSVEFERGKREDKRFITLWLDGKPVVQEESLRDIGGIDV